MKIKIFSREENLEKIIEELKKGNIEVVNTEADLYIFEAGYKRDQIIGKRNDEYLILKPTDIIYVMSEGNDVWCAHTNGKDYYVKEKLYEIETILHDQGLIRVNKSFIININHIKTIKTSLNMKFVLTMSNGVKVDVTRTYYYIFKNFIGL